MILQLLAIWSGLSFPSESLRKKTPMFTFDSESTNPFYCNQLQRRQQCLSTFRSQNLRQCLQQCIISPAENTQSRECRKRVSTSPSILVHISLANSAIQPDGNTKSGESSEEVSTSLGIPELLDRYLRPNFESTFLSTPSAGNT